jgi:hypothetical protein
MLLFYQANLQRLGVVYKKINLKQNQLFNNLQIIEEVLVQRIVKIVFKDLKLREESLS